MMIRMMRLIAAAIFLVAALVWRPVTIQAQENPCVMVSIGCYADNCGSYTYPPPMNPWAFWWWYCLDNDGSWSGPYGGPNGCCMYA